MPHTITFAEIVRKIHPDLNPEIQDPGGKMVMAKRHRDNPEFLFRLAVRWGLIEGPTEDPRQERARTTNFSGDTEGNVHYFRAGDMVTFRNFGRGVIVDITPVKNGYRKGWPKYTIFFFNSNELRELKMMYRHVHYDCPLNACPLIYIGDPSEHERDRAMKVWQDYLDRKKAHSEYRKARREAYQEHRQERAEKQGVTPNTNYRGKHVYILPKNVGRYVRLIRTSAKMAFFEDNGSIKRCNLGTILNVRVED